MRALQLPPEAWLRLRGDNTGITETLRAKVQPLLLMHLPFKSLLLLLLASMCAHLCRYAKDHSSSGWEAWQHFAGVCDLTWVALFGGDCPWFPASLQPRRVSLARFADVGHLPIEMVTFH